MLLRNIKYVVSILLATIVYIAHAQQDVKLPGIVIEQNSKVKTGKVIYVQGASIKATQAVPQMSDANGKFTLLFADVPVGNVTHINVERNGYEVVNSKVLQAAAIAGRKAPLEIVMCKSGLLYQNQLMYYSIATDAIREQYENKIKVLEQGGKNKDDLIARLQKEMNKEIKSKDDAVKSLKEQYQLQLQQSQSLADKLVAVNLDDESQTYQRAFKAFENADIEKAIFLLDSVNLENRLATNVAELRKEESSTNDFQKDIEKRKLQIQQDVSQCMFKSRLHILKNDYKTATQTYLLALQYDSANTDNLMEVGSYFLNQHSDSLAKKYFNQLLSVTTTDYDKAIALADIADAYKNIGAYEEAERYYPLAVKILNQLYQKDPAEYRAALTGVINRFGSLYYDWEFYATAGNYFKQADDIYVQSYDSLTNPLIPAAENLVWYDILNNQCLLYYKYKNYYAAMRYYNFQAIPLLEKSVEKNPGVYDGRLARAWYNQGLSEFYLKDYEHAGDDISKGIAEIRNLAEKNPDRYAADLADMLDGIGRLSYQLKVYDKAAQLHTEALSVIRKATDKNSSEINMSYLAAILNNLGSDYDQLNDYKKAEGFYEEALNIQTQLAEKKPFVYSSQLASTLNSYGELYFHSHNYQKAFTYYNNALNNYKKLAEKNAEIYAADEADVLYNIGSLNMSLKKYDSAEQYYLQALTIQSEIVNREKKETISENSDALRLSLPRLSTMLNSLELLYHNWNGNTKTNQLYADAKKEYTRLWEKNKLKSLESVIMLNDVGKFCYKLGIYSKAEQCFNNALEQFLALSEEDQKYGYGFDIANTAIDILSVYQKEFELTKDFSYRDKALKFISKATQWNESDPGSYDYSYNKERIAEFDSIFKKTTAKDLNVTTGYLEDTENKLKNILEEKDTLAVIAVLEQLINELESKRKESPRNPKLSSLLSQACGSISFYYVFKKQYSKTVTFAKRGLALDSTQTWIYSNLALGYLAQGMWLQAKKIYEGYKDFLIDPDHSYKDMFLDDLHALREAGLLLPNMREAEEFLLKD